jgi:hypothetical protein
MLNPWATDFVPSGGVRPSAHLTYQLFKWGNALQSNWTVRLCIALHRA